MSLHLLANRTGGADLRLVERGYIGRRRWRGSVQEVFEDPLTAQHRRGAGGIGRDGENAGLRQDAATRCAGEVDLTELSALDARDAVEGSQLLIQEGILAIDEVEDAAVLAD